MRTWLHFFTDFFDGSAITISEVLDAWGCREGWLQGEIFRFGRSRGVRVNEYSLGRGKKADLYCASAPRMIAEIKVLGADYLTKMRYALDADVDRLEAVVDGELEKYMILVIPKSDAITKLGKHLHGVCYSPQCFDKTYPGFKLRIWQLERTKA